MGGFAAHPGHEIPGLLNCGGDGPLAEYAALHQEGGGVQDTGHTLTQHHCEGSPDAGELCDKEH